MRILLTIGQLSVFAGGSLVPLEVAQQLVSKGHSCTLVASYLGEPLLSIARRSGIKIVTDATELHAFNYDLVWVQNNTAALLGFELSAQARDRTAFIFSHLSTTTHLEQPSPVFEPLLADVILANSDETRRHLERFGVMATVFPNPAPPAFWRERAPVGNAKLRTVVVISNHPPPEVLEALSLLAQRGVRTRLVGRREGGEPTAVTPKLIFTSSVIVSIGKSVQYSIAAGVPAYVYDRYGGPGYLNAGNFDAAAFTNFSGRCCAKKMTGLEIADDIMGRFAEGAGFVRDLPNASLAAFRLEPHLDRLLDEIRRAPLNTDRAARMASQAPALLRERAMVLAIRENFAGHHREIQKVKAWAKRAHLAEALRAKAAGPAGAIPTPSGSAKT